MILKYILRNNKTSAKIAVVQVVTFIDLHNLNIVVMVFYIDINLSNLYVLMLESVELILTIMYT